MSEGPMSLAKGFPVAEQSTWMALVEKTLRGRDPTEALTSETADGNRIAALYRAGDRPAHGPGIPGEYPYIRGAAAVGDAEKWDVRQICAVAHPKDALEAMKAEFAGGATSVELRFDRSRSMDGEEADGLCVGDAADLREIVDLAGAAQRPLAVDAGPFVADVAGMLHGLGAMGLHLNADPLGAAAVGHGSLGGALGGAVELVRRAPSGWTALRCDGEVYHAAGGSAAQELAAMVATGIAYLRALSNAGIELDAARAHIRFRLAADDDIFTSIAKPRAFRRLWGRVVEVCGGTGSADVEMVTATRMMTTRDPWVNLLRTTCAAFAGVVGGARVISVLPYDHAIGTGEPRAARLARNIQLLLSEESNLHRVADPAGGGYYIEHLTDEFARDAWAGIQRIEAAGGMVAALREGLVQDEIAETFMTRLARVARLEDPITGASTFPSLHEGLPMAPGTEPASLPQAMKRPDFDPIASPLRPMRLAEGFERLRDIADAAVRNGGERPRILLATLGPLAEHATRAAYAKNAFEAGGIEAVEAGELQDAAAAGAAMRNSACRVACLCGTDERYASMAAEVADALREAGADAVYLAGRPSSALEQIPLDGFVHLGCNLLARLEDVHSLLMGDRS